MYLVGILLPRPFPRLLDVFRVATANWKPGTNRSYCKQAPVQEACTFGTDFLEYREAMLGRGLVLDGQLA